MKTYPTGEGGPKGKQGVSAYEDAEPRGAGKGGDGFPPAGAGDGGVGPKVVKSPDGNRTKRVHGKD